jgi:hypothetical protein
MEAIRNYFNAEKYESILFVLIGLIAFVFAIYFIFFQKENFYKGLAIPLVAIALIQIVVGSSVWIRSPKDIERVENVVRTELSKIQTEEIPRMEVVMKNFIIYRYVEIGLLVMGLICMYFSGANPFIKGIGVGLFIQSTIMLGLDFFAEKRGAEYLAYILTKIT